MELAFTGSFALAAWQVLGRLRKHAAKIEETVNDGLLLGQWEDECKALVAQQRRASPAMGQGASDTGHDHIWEDWRARKLKPQQQIQLVMDVAEVAQWAGAGSWVPELRGEGPLKPWGKYGTAAKVHLLQAADALQFNFAESAKRQAEALGASWLWQVTEALPALSAEPVRAAAPAEPLGDLKGRLAEAEAAVRAAYDGERGSGARGLRGLVEPLRVAACARRMQVLRVLLDEVGLTPANAAAAVQTIRTELASPPLTLTPAAAEVAEQKAAAAAAVAAEAEAAVVAERDVRMAEIEAAAAKSYRRTLTLQASSPSHWHASSDTPALHRLGLLAALLGELTACDEAAASTAADGGAAAATAAAAAAADLADSVRKLTPQLRVKLSEDEIARRTALLEALTPAPPPPPPAEVETEAAAEAAEAAEAEVAADGGATAAAEDAEESAAEEAAEAETAEEGKAASEEAAEAEAEAEVPPPPSASTPLRPSPAAAASELRLLLEAAIRTQLAAAREERRAARAASRAEAKAAAKAAKAAEAQAKAEAETAAAAEASAAAEAAEAEAKAAVEEDEETATAGEEEEKEEAETNAPAAADSASAEAQEEPPQQQQAAEEEEVVEAAEAAAEEQEEQEEEEGTVALGFEVVEEQLVLSLQAKKREKKAAKEEGSEAAAVPAAAEGEEEKEAEEQEEAAEQSSSDESLEQQAPAQEEVAEEAAAEEAAEAATEAPAAAAEGKEEEHEEEEQEEEEEEEPPTAEEAVDVDGVKQGVEAEARARAEAEKEAAVMKLTDALEALRTSVADKAMQTLIAAVNEAVDAADGAAAAAGPDAGSRILALEAQLRAAASGVGAGGSTATSVAEATALARAAAAAVGKLTAADRVVLDAASTAAVSRVAVAAARVLLTAEAARLEMGPGCCEVLRRLDGWLDEQEKAVAAEAEARAAKAAAKAAEAAAKAAAKAAAAEAAEAAKAAEAEKPVTEAEEEEKKETGENAEEEKAEEEKAEEAKEEEAKEEEAKEEEVKQEESDQEEEEEEEANVPAVDPERLGSGRRLIAELLGEGLVLLELPPPAYRKLQALREAVDALDPVAGEGAVQHRLLGTLQELVGQLGPIGASVDARLSKVVEAGEREKLMQVRTTALSIYAALTAFLKLETRGWVAAREDMAKAKEAVYGIKIERRAASLASAMTACGAVAERCAALAGGVLQLAAAEAAVQAAVRQAAAALQAAAEAAQSLCTSLGEYISYVRLREAALGQPVSAAADTEDDYELSMPTLEDMAGRHGGEAEWLDLGGLGLPPPPEQAEDEEEGGAGSDGEEAEAEAERAAQQAAHDAALDALQERLDGWHAAGLRLLARGRAALVTLGGAFLDSGELRLTADVGLPSAKCLLQLTAERLSRLQLLAAESVAGAGAGVECPLQWYLLVPSAAAPPLEACLRDNNFFGLLPGQVHVYINDVLPPLLTEDLRAVMEAGPGLKVARSQPGSGEVFVALRRSGALTHMRRAGVSYIEVAAVEDNLPARPLDPGFLGACTAVGADCAAKVAVPGVQTEGPSALPEIYSRYLGLLGTSSHLLPALSAAVPAIGTYFFSMSYVRKVDELLTKQPMALYRLAPAEKVPPVTRGSVGAAAATAPATAAAAKAGTAGAAAAAATAAGAGAAGYRLERRLSDFASPLMRSYLGPEVRIALAAVDVGAEFGPVWGAAPFYRTASPAAAVDAMLLQHTRWVEENGGAVADEDGVVEVAPLVSYGGEGLGPLVEGRTFEQAYVRELQGFSPQSSGAASNVGLWALPPLALSAGVAAWKLLGGAAAAAAGGKK